METTITCFLEKKKRGGVEEATSVTKSRAGDGALWQMSQIQTVTARGFKVLYTSPTCICLYFETGY